MSLLSIQSPGVGHQSPRRKRIYGCSPSRRALEAGHSQHHVALVGNPAPQLHFLFAVNTSIMLGDIMQSAKPAALPEQVLGPCLQMALTAPACAKQHF